MELKKTFEITLDVEKELYSPSTLLFSVSRNDFETIELQFTIEQDGAPLDLTGTTVELAIKKPSGLTVYSPCEITNALEGKARILLSVQAYAEYGVFTAEVYIRTANQLAVTSPFWYSARSAIMNTDDFESVNDWSALQQALLAYDLRPVLTDGFPTIEPEYIGQMAFDRLNDITYIATDLTSASWRTFSTGEGGGGANDTILGEGAPTVTPVRIGQFFIDTLNNQAYISTGATAGDWERIDNEVVADNPEAPTSITWADILNKPLTFPPDAHSHGWAEVTGKPTAFTPEIHTHDYVDITGKPLTFPPDAHNHDYADITGKPLAFPPETHTHDYIDITGKPLTFPPDAHTHAYAEITGKPATFTPEAHTHEILDVNGLSLALDGKADDVHSHAYTEITGKPLTFPPEAHAHEILDVNGLSLALDGKADATDVYTKLETYNKTEVYNKNEIDQMTFDGGGSPVIVEDNLTSISTTNALSANQGRILNETKADENHVHTYTEITGKPLTFPPEAHAHTKADITDFAHNHTYAEITEKPLTFPPDVHSHAYAEITGKPLTFPPETHTHTKADITDFAHSHLWADITDKPTTFTPDAHSHAITDITNLEATLEGKDEKPITGAGTPTIIPSYVGQLYVDTTNREAYVANGLTAGDWQIFSDDEEIKAHTHLWADITDKPATFTPEAHAHTYAEITEKPLTFPPDVHSHAYTEITGKPLTFPPEAHAHTKADITDFAHNHLWADITDKPATFTPSAHSHDYAEITGKPTAFTPEAHTHLWADITDKPATFTPSAHTHEIANITGLTDALGDKADKPEAVVGLPATTPKYLGEIQIEAGTGDTGKTYIANGTTADTWERLADTKYVDVSFADIRDNYLNGLKLWSGTQTAYNNIVTKDPTTLYFITG